MRSSSERILKPWTAHSLSPAMVEEVEAMLKGIDIIRQYTDILELIREDRSLDIYKNAIFNISAAYSDSADIEKRIQSV